MKRFLLLAIAAWLSLGVGDAWAGTARDPGAMPAKGKFAVGVEGAWIFAQDFKDLDAEVSRGAAHYSVAVKDAKITNDKAFMASVVYGVSDRFSLYAKLGIKDGGRFKFSNWDADSGTWWSNKFKLKSVFAWALGAKVGLFETPAGLGALLSGQYQRYDDRKTGEMESLGHGVSLNDFTADYWQADVAASVYQNLGPLTLYAGLGYERAELSIAGNANLGTVYANHIDLRDMKNNDNLSAFVGLGWRPASNLSLTLQGDFSAHDAVALGVNWAF